MSPAITSRIKIGTASRIHRNTHFLREIKDLNVIPEEFKGSPEVIKAIEIAEESAYTPVDLEAYDEYLDAIRVEQTVRQDSYEEGEQVGLRKGEEKLEEEKMNMAS